VPDTPATTVARQPQPTTSTTAPNLLGGLFSPPTTRP
jgi:hypothetical protein